MELVPIQYVGRMVLNRNPDNFFAETEQVAFCAAHVVPGIDFSNDPLLAGRIHSYMDTQISRLGGANFHEIPINAPIAQAHNNQRDGMHRQAIHRGRVAYEPNSLAGGCPFQAGAQQGFMTFSERQQSHEDHAKVRGKPEKFADHYTQATLFYVSQTPLEQAHIVQAFCFELSKLTVPAIRERMISSLRNVSDDLASKVAQGLGIDPMPSAMPRALDKPQNPEVKNSPSLSLTARPGDGSVKGLRVALLIADGVNGKSISQIQSALAAKGAISRLVGPRIGPITTEEGGVVIAQSSLDNEPGYLFDALVLPNGKKAVEVLAAHRLTTDFIKDHYFHCKTIFALPQSKMLLKLAECSAELPDGSPDPGLIIGTHMVTSPSTDTFLQALALMRHAERAIYF